MKYTVTGGAKPVVKFNCPTCNAALESPLEDAGQQYGCPTCAHILVVPGEHHLAELRERAAMAKLREANAEAQRREAQVRANEELRARQARAEMEIAAVEESKKLSTFSDVPGAASRLRAADYVLSLIGWVYVAIGLVGFLVSIVVVGGQGENQAPRLLLLFLYCGCAIAGGVVLMGVGAALRMIASIGIGVAEIARNNPNPD